MAFGMTSGVQYGETFMMIIILTVLFLTIYFAIDKGLANSRTLPKMTDQELRDELTRRQDLTELSDEVESLKRELQELKSSKVEWYPTV